MITQIETKTYTPEEYLELEIASENRNEYRNGEIISMTGGTPDHNEIAANLNAFLKFALRGKPYRSFIIDQRLWIPTVNLYTYLDQYKIYVEHYVKTNINQWLLSEYNDPNITLSFSSFEFELLIADLYENVELS